jgi:hypothetical protein
MIRTLSLLCLFTANLCLAQQATPQPNFATTEEIRLVLTQSERVFEQYRSVVEMEAAVPAHSKTNLGVEKDQQVLGASKKLIDGLKQNPKAFNGKAGYYLLGLLDDASRNAALCSGSAMADASQKLLSGNKTDVSVMIHLADTCQSMSAQFYTVSENVNALMERYFDGQEMLNDKVNELIAHCNGAIKKNPAPKLK